MKRTALALLVLAGTATPAAAGGGCHTNGRPSDQAAVTTVRIDHACFRPGVALVAPGAEVTFVNDSGLEHNLTGPAFDYTELPDGGSAKMTFAEPGLYPFACTLHPGMSGVVVAGALPSAPAAAPAAVAPVPTTGGDDSSAAPLVAGGIAAAVVAGAVVGFGRRTKGVPLPAR